MADGSGLTIEKPSLRSVEIHLRAIREAEREVDFVCSTETRDSYGTILKQDWDLKRYKKNPVVFFAHDRDDLPVGQATRVEVVDGQLVATVRIASAAANPLAENVWQSIREKTLRGISVGFCPHSYKWEMDGDVETLILFDNELLELSICPLPSNPEALAQLRSWTSEKRGALPQQSGAPNNNDSATPMSAATKETSMDPKEKAAFEARIVDLEKTNKDLEFSARTVAADLKDKTDRVADLETQNKALSGQTERLAQERDAALKRAEAAEDEINKHEVRALVGSKISAAEVEDFVELRKSNKPLFERMVGQRKDMKLTEQVLSTEGNGAPAAPPASESRSVEDETVEWEVFQAKALKRGE